MASPRRSGQRLFDGPSGGVQPLPDRCAFQSGDFAPLRDCSGDAIQRQMTTGARIVVLFDRCSPVAILWRIAQFVIASFNRMADRTAAHISQKRWKAVSPSVADRNPSCPIVLIGADIRRIAAPFDIGPCAVFLRRMSCWRVSVRAAHGALKQFFETTAARGGLPVSHSVSMNHLNCSAVAPAQPFSWIERMKRQHCQAAIPVTGNHHLRLWHMAHFNMFVVSF